MKRGNGLFLYNPWRVLQFQRLRAQLNLDIWSCQRFPCPGVGIFHTSIKLGLRMVKELDLKLTRGMTGR